MYGKTFLKGIGYYFFADILCLFLTVTLIMLGTLLFKIICVLCCMGVLICLMINYAINCEKEDRKYGLNQNAGRSLFPGLAASSVYILLYLLLLLAKLQLLPDSFYRIYKILNAPFMTLFNFLEPGVLASELSLISMIVFFLLSLIPMAAVIISYTLSAKDIIPEDFMFQKQK
ncbi:MAG: hypothetical protein IJ512_05065 [Ruminococcus sp.]|nr:hypothetical protein [Ruminococcus sp.]